MVVALDARERLLDAADQLMWQRGYEAVGVADLCQSAGAPRGSFYHWFPSKQALTLAMLARSWERLRAALFEPAFSIDAPFVDQFDGYVERLVAHLRTARRTSGHVAGCRFGNMAAELSTRDPDVRAAIDAIFDDMRGIYSTAIAAGIASGELQPNTDPDDVAESLCAHMEGLMLLAKTRNDPSVLERLSSDARLLVGLARTDRRTSRTTRPDRPSRKRANR